MSSEPGPGGPLDGDRLLELARRSAVGPLAAEGARRGPGLQVPDGIADRLAQHARQVALRNLSLAGQLHRLLQLFESHGVRALAFKGPTLAVEAYGDLSFREFVDLDLLIDRSQLEHAVQLAEQLQYRCVLPVPARDLPAQLRRFRQVPLVRPEGFSMVELHTDLTTSGFGCRWDMQALWPTRKQVEVCGKAVAGLGTEELVLYLAVHGGLHLWDRLGWICDVAALTARATIDWDRVLESAAELRVRRLLLLALHLAEDLLGPRERGGLPQALGRDPAVERLARDVWRRLFREPAGTRTAWETVGFHLRARERLRDGLRYAAEQVLSPTPLDAKLLPFPHRLPLLAYAVRPFRLAGKYLWKSLRGWRGRGP